MFSFFFQVQMCTRRLLLDLGFWKIEHVAQTPVRVLSSPSPTCLPWTWTYRAGKLKVILGWGSGCHSTASGWTFLCCLGNASCSWHFDGAPTMPASLPSTQEARALALRSWKLSEAGDARGSITIHRVVVDTQPIHGIFLLRLGKSIFR